jgi:Flp pilus assembly protein TadG
MRLRVSGAVAAARRALRRRPRDERGSFTFVVVFWALMTMVLGGLVIDGGLAITERQRIGDIAEQAARAAADDLDQDQLRQGNYTLAGDFPAKCAAVVKASGLDPTSAITRCQQTGTKTLAGGQVVPVVTVGLTFTYNPILLSMFYSGTFTANATATAYPQPGF